MEFFFFGEGGLDYSPLLFALYKMKAGVIILVYSPDTIPNPWILIKMDNAGQCPNFTQNAILIHAGAIFYTRFTLNLINFSI
jgi:hypothetical protein